VPNADMISDSIWLNALLEKSIGWTRGRVYSANSTRIGADYGFSGMVYRVGMTTEFGPATIIAKIESPENTRTAVSAHQHISPILRENVPLLYAHEVTEVGGTLLLEDVTPAIQGDDLTGCSKDQAMDIVRLVSHLHRATRLEAAPPGVAVFTTRISDKRHWSRVLAQATARYPQFLTSDRLDRLALLLSELPELVRILGRQPISWIHVDPHLDNILWRPDGSPVLLDWSNARVGPSVIDVAAMLIGYSFRSRPAIEPMDLIRSYRNWVDRPLADLVRGVTAALKSVFIQSIVGWAGERPTDGLLDRKTTLRDDTIGRAIRALDWVDRL
jgi:Phosphotransferase enzyme family